MGGMFEIYVEAHFSAAHRLAGYPGDCARSHGHNWMVEVFVKCRELDDVGIGIDFRTIKAAVQEVVNRLDHFDLNELEPFKTMNPTSENIARYLYRELSKTLNSESARVFRVKVAETPGTGVVYWEE